MPPGHPGGLSQFFLHFPHATCSLWLKAGSGQRLFVANWQGQDHAAREGRDAGVFQQDGGVLPEGRGAASGTGYQLRGALLWVMDADSCGLWMQTLVVAGQSRSTCYMPYEEGAVLRRFGIMVVTSCPIEHVL